MTDKRRLLEDRAMRDAARQVVTGTVAHLKAEARSPGMAGRALSAGADHARVLGEGALDMAREYRKPLTGAAVALGAGLAAWLFRQELADLFTRLTASGGEDESDSD